MLAAAHPLGRVVRRRFNVDSGIAVWVGSITGVLALALSGITFFTSRRDASKSAAAAERSAKAAEGATEVAREQLTLSRAEAERYVPPWRLAWSHASVYALINDGSETEYGVTVEANDGVVRLDAPDPTDIQPGSSVQFMAATAWQSKPAVISVRWWRDGSRDGVPLEWTCPLPAKGT